MSHQNLAQTRSPNRSCALTASLLAAAFAVFAIEGPQWAAAQDMSRFAPTAGDSSEAPSPKSSLLHDVANTRPVIESCLESKASGGESQTQCLGLTMTTCLAFDSNQTTTGSVLCAAGEEAGWAAILNDAVERTRAKMDEGQRSALQKSQELWLAHRQASCGLWFEVFRGGSLARQIGADCIREATARRALDILAVEEAFGL